MQGPLVDLVVLALLVLLFGLQLRTRPRLIFRFWFAGWILLFCSLLTWEFVLHDPWLSRLQEVLFRGTLDASGLAFMTSFVVRPGKVVRCSVLAVLVFVPALLVIGAVNLSHAPFWALASLFVLGEAAAIFVTLQFPKKWKTRRVVVVVACLLFGAWLIYQAYTESVSRFRSGWKPRYSFALRCSSLDGRKRIRWADWSDRWAFSVGDLPMLLPPN